MDERLRLLVELEDSLKTPLLAAIRTADMAIDRGQPTTEDLVVIRAFCTRMYAQLSTARIFARIASGEQVSVDVVPVSLSQVLRMLHITARDAEALERRDNRNRIEVETDAPQDISVDVDISLFEVAIRNVLDNAIKYSYHGTPIRITVAGRAGLEIAVANKGLRLQPAEVQQVFERGWRSRSAMSVRGEGSGIGLWIVQQAMKALDGSVSIDVADDLTTVKLCLPYSKHATTDR